MQILTTCFLLSNFLLRIIAILFVYIRHLFNDYIDDNNKCKFTGLLSYTMYQLNVLIPISLYKILVIYIHSIRMNE